MNHADETANQIMALDRAALDRWGKGDPGGYLELSAPDTTYFDPVLARRIDGYRALEEHFIPIAGKVSIDRYEMLNAHVTVEGASALLTYNLVDYVSGEPKPTRWNVTQVYRRSEEGWKIIHSHYSFTQPEPVRTA